MFYSRVSPCQIGPKKCKNGSDPFRFFSNLAHLLAYMREWNIQIFRSLWPPGASVGACKVLASRPDNLILRGCGRHVFKDIFKIPTGMGTYYPRLHFLQNPFFDPTTFSRPFFGLDFLKVRISQFFWIFDMLSPYQCRMRFKRENSGYLL